MGATCRDEIERACVGAAEALARLQRPDGAFQSFMARDAALTLECVPDETPFVTCMIAASLQASRIAGMRDVLTGALDYLQRQMEPFGVWRYWGKAHERYGWIPPDLDDTCCSSYVLRHAGRAIPDNAALILANRDRRGRFYTWLIPRLQPTSSLAFWGATLRELPRFPSHLALWRLTEASRGDIDGVVNANVLRYVGECEASRGAIGFVLDILRNGTEAECDKWYLNAHSFYYAVAHAYAEGITALEECRETIRQRIENRSIETGMPGANPVENAMAVSALRCLGIESWTIEAMQDYLLRTQRSDGTWPGQVVYWGGPRRFYGWGADALTTALCLEALTPVD